jgi:poly-gamma-glutamate synthesis protein (capsule biosynthesis protein)
MRIPIYAKLILFLAISATTFARAEEAGKDTLVIAGVGDMMLEGSFKEGHYQEAFDGTREILQAADIAFGNCEGPISTKGEEFKTKTYRFRQKPETADALKSAGFDIVALANNHAMDYGAEAIYETFTQLDRVGIKYAGAGRDLKQARAPAIIEKNGYKIGLLAYTLCFPEEFWAAENKPGNPFGHEQAVREDVKKLRPLVDVLIISFHWSAELRTTPKDYQFALAKAAMAEGADIIFGHHPHLWQGIGFIEKKPVFYSMGNFAFRSYSVSTGDTGIARVTVKKNGKGGVNIEKVEVIPVNSYHKDVNYTPRVEKGEAGQRILKRILDLSTPLGTKGEIKENVLVVGQ